MDQGERLLLNFIVAGLSATSEFQARYNNTIVTHTLSVTIRSKPWVNARLAISRWTSMPQFLERASATAREYNCTFAFRCARRLRTAAITLRALERAKSSEHEAAVADEDNSLTLVLPRPGLYHRG